MSKRKIYKTNPIRKYVILSLFLFLFIGIGFSTLGTLLDINGTIQLNKYLEPTVSNVLQKEYNNGGLVRKYTGETNDSPIGEETEDVYYWYATNASTANQILEKNNVVFANNCWQILRTTATGGVRLLYNGEYDETNKCNDNRPKHYGFTSGSWLTSDEYYFNGTYYYGTDYTFDNSTNTFSLSGTVATYNYATNPTAVIGKYTCRSSSITGTCSTLYLINAPSSTYNASASITKLIDYNNIGATGHYDIDGRSLSAISYMAGSSNYNYTYRLYENEKNYGIQTNFLTSASLSTTYYYADTISYDPTTNKYTLENPYKVNTTDDYSSLVGKYTLISSDETSSNSEIYYISYISGTRMYYNTFTDGKDVNSIKNIVFGESITDNNNGTYTINDTTTNDMTNWYTNYRSYSEKYTCLNNSSTCANPILLVVTKASYYKYVNLNEQIMIGKGYSGATLTNTITISKAELAKNYNDYLDYRYTCHTDSNNCTTDNISYIKNFYSGSYEYLENYKHGSSVSWDGSKYTLQDVKDMSLSYDDFVTHHYMCLEKNATQCETVAYVYFYFSDYIEYIELNEGTTIEDALNEILSNKNSSIPKIFIENWYEKNLIEYDNYIEDSVYCNDRSIYLYGGWALDGKLNSYLAFRGYDSHKLINCPREIDRLSTRNANGRLKYKIGLPTMPELNLLNNSNVRKSSSYYMTMTPYYTEERRPYYIYIDADGYINKTSAMGDGKTLGIRPTITLKKTVEYESGTGSKNDPYIVDTN